MINENIQYRTILINVKNQGGFNAPPLNIKTMNNNLKKIEQMSKELAELVNQEFDAMVDLSHESGKSQETIEEMETKIEELRHFSNELEGLEGFAFDNKEKRY